MKVLMTIWALSHWILHLDALWMRASQPSSAPQAAQPIPVWVRTGVNTCVHMCQAPGIALPILLPLCLSFPAAPWQHPRVFPAIQTFPPKNPFTPFLAIWEWERGNKRVQEG